MYAAAFLYSQHRVDGMGGPLSSAGLWQPALCTLARTCFALKYCNVQYALPAGSVVPRILPYAEHGCTAYARRFTLITPPFAMPIDYRTYGRMSAYGGFRREAS